MVFKQGATGDGVKSLQEKLNKLGYNCGAADGIFGQRTKEAVIAFQHAYGIAIDAVVGPQTLATLDKAIQTKKDCFLQVGVKNTNVAVVQTKLNSLGFNCGKVDGDFGLKTKSAVIAFQASRHLVQDGIVGPITLAELEKALSIQVHYPERLPQVPKEIQTVSFPNHFDQVPDRTVTKFCGLHHVNGDLDILGVNNYHLSKGWAGIGYNIFVTLKGEVIMGRGLYKVPAAMYGLNDQSINICLQGDFSKNNPTAAQLAALDWLIPYIKTVFPGITVIGHCDAVKYISWATATECPGKKFPLQDVKKKFN